MDFYLSEENCYQRLENEYKKYGRLIFCVDFDDTLFDFHKLGRTYDDMFKLLKRWENYSEVIIYTGNPPSVHPSIRKYLNERGLKFKGINCESSVKTNSIKPYANVYIDDRGGLPFVYQMLNKLITKIEKGEIAND